MAHGTTNPQPTTRRSAMLTMLGSALAVAGCGGRSETPEPQGSETTWGVRGISDGRLQKPRAMTINDRNEVFIVDMTGRIQVFDTEGTFLRSWRTPESKNGKPTGMSLDRDDHLVVADTHYFRVLFYTPEGKLLKQRTIGGQHGHAPGEFNFVTDVTQDSHGNYYVSEYGLHDRIQKFTPDGEFVLQWGTHGSDPGQFRRPQSMKFDAEDRLWVSDACNHRIQVFDPTGDEVELLEVWGESGTEPGKLSFPYDLILDDDYLYVCEFGNHRVQKLTKQGECIECWGRAGRGVGELSRPWALAQDNAERLYVLDTYNHRVQRIRM